MTIHELRYELSSGIRLPDPTFCPARISELIQRCFLEDPNQRPTFKEIKEDLTAEDDILISNLYSSVETTNGTETQRQAYATALPINKVKDDRMQRRFTSIREKNRRRHSGETPDQNNDELLATEEEVSEKN